MQLYEFRDRSSLRRGVVAEIDEHFVDIAPAPAFRRIVAFDDRVPGGVEMLRGMLVGRIVATADVTAGAAQPQMHPPASGLQAFFAAERARRYLADGSSMRA